MTWANVNGKRLALTRATWISLTAATAWLMLAFLRMWWQPILTDEWDFYRAMTDWQNNRALIPHPQAYVHLAQLFMAVLGQTPNTVRLIGMACAVINVWLAPVLIHLFWPLHPRRNDMAVAAIWLTALNPLTIQNGMLIDIDNTLLTSWLLGMLLLWKVAQDWTLGRRIAGLGLAFAIALWIKLTTPVLLMASFGAFYLAQGKLKRVIEMALAVMLGYLIFLLTFSIYSRLTGFTFAYFGPSFSKLPRDANSIPAALVLVPQNAGVFAMWLSLPMLALGLIVVARTCLRLIQRRMEQPDLLVIYTLITLSFYTFIPLPPAWGYPRYQAPVVPVIASLAAVISVEAYDSLSRQVRLAVLGLGLAALAYQFLVIGDPFWSLYQVTFETSLGDVSQRMAQGLAELSRLAIPIAVVLVIAYGLSRRWRANPQATILLSLGALSLAHMLDANLVQVPAQYSTRYRYTYEYSDLSRAIDDVRNTHGQYVLALKEVLYYSGLPGEEIYAYVWPGRSPQALVSKLTSTRVDAMAWTTKEDNRSPEIVQNPAVVALLNRCYRRVTHGVFIVYLYKAENCP